jgi:signal transduction histidine kinase
VVVEHNESALRDADPKTLTTRVRCKDGRIIWCEVNVRALRDEAGNTTHFVGVTRDVTARKALQDALERAHQELREIDQSRIQLLNNVAHDLANAMTPIRLRLAAMERRGVPAPIVAGMESLQRYADRLTRLVEDVRDVARAQGGALAVDRRPMDLTSLVRTAVADYEPVLRTRGLSTTVVAPRALAVQGDEGRIRQIMANLLGNAAKFTPSGGAVDISCQAQGENALVSVQDDGIGFDPRDEGRLFQPFVQIHAANEADEHGTGLGLYICKQIIERHDGRIWAKSAGPGQGAVFAFSVPLQSPPGERSATIPGHGVSLGRAAR